MKKDQSMPPANIDTVYTHTPHGNLYLQFRSGDIKGDDWYQPSRLEVFFGQLGEQLHF